MTKQETKTVQANVPVIGKPRSLGIDRLRGICMFFMIGSFILGVFEDFWPGFEKIVPYIAHAQDGGKQLLPGIAFADLFAPLFIFVIGLTFVKSFRSREKLYGTRVAFWQMAVRYLGLMGIGALLNGFEDGWGDIFQGSKWAELDKNIKVFMIGFCIVVAILLVLAVAQFFKNPKFKEVVGKVLRYTLAFFGICVLFFMIVSLGEKVGAWTGSQIVYPGEKFGGWIWDTLQNIGLAGLIALPFVKMDKWGRFIMTMIGFVALTIFYQHNGFELSRTILEGGLIGAWTWAGILLLGSFFGEMQEEKNKLYWPIAALLFAVSAILIVGYNYISAKRGCTPVYAGICASVGAMLYSGICCLNNWHPKFDFFAWWGGNCITTYTVNYMICLIIGLILTLTEATISAVWVFVIAIVYYVLFSVANWLMAKYNKHIRL